MKLGHLGGRRARRSRVGQGQGGQTLGPEGTRCIAVRIFLATSSDLMKATRRSGPLHFEQRSSNPKVRRKSSDQEICLDVFLGLSCEGGVGSTGAATGAAKPRGVGAGWAGPSPRRGNDLGARGSVRREHAKVSDGMPLGRWNQRREACNEGERI